MQAPVQQKQVHWNSSGAVVLGRTPAEPVQVSLILECPPVLARFMQ